MSLECHLYLEEFIPLGKYETWEKLWNNAKKTKSTLLGNCRVEEICNESLTLDFVLLSLCDSGFSTRDGFGSLCMAMSRDLLVTAERVWCACGISGLESRAVARTCQQTGSRLSRGLALSVGRRPERPRSIALGCPLLPKYLWHLGMQKNRVPAFPQASLSLPFSRFVCLFSGRSLKKETKGVL